ncbi:MAG: molybdopterin-containing oxidoreductase family protein [Dehalococcoidia bacterium]
MTEPPGGVKRAGCAFCGANCGVLVHLEDGKVSRIEGNKEHGLTLGHICERVRYAPKWLYHSDQLMHPLKRAGERGEGQWQRISWEQAFDEIAAKLSSIRKRFGPESLVVTEGTYRAGSFWIRSRFLNLFGNPQNVAHPGVICLLNCYAIDMALIGGCCSQTPNISHSNCVVFWGQNPASSSPRTMAAVKKRRHHHGSHIIVIDPRRTKTAQLADMWLQIRPGTDAAVALGWLNVIINEELYDKDFVSRWTYGFEQLAQRVQEYSPAKVAEIAGLTEEQIISSAKLYATSNPACIVRGVASDQIGRNAGRVEQARVILRAITGNLDVRGGDLIPGIGPEIDGNRFRREVLLELIHRLPPEQRPKQIGADRFRVMSWQAYELTSQHYENFWGMPEPVLHRVAASPPLTWRAILSGKPYPIKAMITWDSNPLLWAGNTRLVYEALKSKNLEVHVVCDFWLTPTAELADYVLPVTSWMERPLCSTFEDLNDVVFGGGRAVPPLGERKDDYTIWRELGIRLGQENDWPWKTYEEAIEYQLEPLGINYEEFAKAGFVRGARKYRKYEGRGFPTPTGKVELYSTVLEKLGYDPLPFYEEPPESPVSTPEVAREYPLILNTGGRFMPMYHSEHRQWGIGMRERRPDPLTDIHPDTAGQLGISEGDWIYIETRRGRIKQRAHLNPGILPNVVNCEASWWFPEKPGAEPSLHGLWESNANVLTLDDPDCCDPLTGGWCNRALLCRVYKV